MNAKESEEPCQGSIISIALHTNDPIHEFYSRRFSVAIH